jgi:hypothetical protein
MVFLSNSKYKETMATPGCELKKDYENILSKPSRKSYEEVFNNTIAPPIPLPKLSNKSFDEVYLKEKHIVSPVVDKTSNNIGLITELAPVKNTEEKLWLQKNTNDIKLQFLNTQLHLLNAYKTNILKELTPRQKKEFSKGLKNKDSLGTTAESEHFKEHMSKLFTEIDAVASNTIKSLERLNGRPIDDI